MMMQQSLLFAIILWKYGFPISLSGKAGRNEQNTVQ